MIKSQLEIKFDNGSSSVKEKLLQRLKGGPVKTDRDRLVFRKSSFIKAENVSVLRFDLSVTITDTMFHKNESAKKYFSNRSLVQMGVDPCLIIRSTIIKTAVFYLKQKTPASVSAIGKKW